jgi:UDP-N-acetylglucosamine--N-acetylmuramyl-(pentapeptide) pyrophosphoryl-undecaprenol N-acetylglucosamine transferase
MVTGGSQGAWAVNAAVSGAAPALRAACVQVLHLTEPQHAVQACRRVRPAAAARR